MGLWKGLRQVLVELPRLSRGSSSQLGMDSWCLGEADVNPAKQPGEQEHRWGPCRLRRLRHQGVPASCREEYPLGDVFPGSQQMCILSQDPLAPPFLSRQLEGALHNGRSVSVL